MASANLDLVRSIVAAWERGDYSSVEWADPEVAFVIADGPTPRNWSGLAAMAREWRAFLHAWEGGLHCEVDDCSELDHERVLVLHHWADVGPASEAGSQGS